MSEPLNYQMGLGLNTEEPVDPFESKADRAQRHAQLSKIQANPAAFMFCEACGNVFMRGGSSEQSGVCFICHGYRFNFDQEEVLMQAIRITSRPRNSVLPGDYA